MVKRSKIGPRATAKTVAQKGLVARTIPSEQQTAETQEMLFPVKVIQHEGFPVMGVLSDGTPYLTQRGLARMCGVDAGVMQRLTSNWEEERTKPRGLKILELLEAQGHDGQVLNVENASKDIGTHVYPDSVCMAILEYYAFEATQGSNAVATKNFRLLARESLRGFIFRKCGYDPNRHIPASWQNFHERVLLNDQTPVGYFCIFREIADMIVHLIKAGCEFDEHTVPDISVGMAWSKFWSESDFDSKYGMRMKFPHVYPGWYPQAAAGPLPAWIYPSTALGAFHLWMQRNYIPQKFPKYLENKVKSGAFLPSRAEALLIAVKRKDIPALPK